MSVRQIVPDVVAQFRQELTDLVKSAEQGALDPLGFTQFVDGLKTVLASAGRQAFVRFVHLQDNVRASAISSSTTTGATGSSRCRRRSG